MDARILDIYVLVLLKPDIAGQIIAMDMFDTPDSVNLFTFI